MYRLTISIENWQKDALDKLLKLNGFSNSEIIRDFLNEYFKGKNPKARRNLTETPDDELNEFDRAVKAWCDNELKKMAQWYLDDLQRQS
jgi:hypothetical protein